MSVISSDEEDDVSIPKQCMSREAMQKLYEMRLNNQLCDAKLSMEDGSIFNVHRAILCACSSYFSSLFTTILNVNKNEFEILGVPSRTMEKLISFAYLRDVREINDDNVYEMYATSDYFGMMGLMKYCVDYMINMLKPENCVSLMLMARFRSINRLLDKAWNYILKYFVVVAVKSKELLELTMEDFFHIINDELLNVKDEQSVWECCIRWIDYDPKTRTKYLTKLMRGVRLGLLTNSYFMEKVKNNPYVDKNPEVRPIIVEAMRFLCDLETMSTNNDEVVTPPFALPRLPHEVIFAIGGWSEGAPQSCIETYDTRADRWVRVLTEDPAGPRSYHGTAVIGTKLFCIGGFNGNDYFNTCSRFDAVKKLWKEVAPMHCRRCYVSVAALKGKIYALGGYDGQTRQNTVELYDPKSNQWTMIAPMHYQRSDADACAFNGKIFITGGFNGQECLNTAEFYNPDTNTWTMLPPMLTRRSGVSCVAHRGYMYVIGGFNGLSRMNTGERYDPDKKVWTSIREMYHPRSNFGLEIIDDMLFAIGGFNGVVTISHTECYVPETDEWLEATDMSIIRSALTANVVVGLPNVRDYIHQERHKLMEERRLKIFGNEQSEMSLELDIDLDGELADNEEEPDLELNFDEIENN